MSRSTPKKFLHIGNPADATWVTVLHEAIAPLGQLDSVSEPEISSRLQQGQYDLMLLDAAAMNDVEALISTLHQQYPNIPIVVVTTSPTWQRARRVLLAGAADYIRKSLDSDELLATFQSILTR